MKKSVKTTSRGGLLFFLLILLGSLVVAGCEGEATKKEETEPTYAPLLNMSLPDSLTGGTGDTTPTSSRYTPMAAGGDPCGFNGQHEQNWHENGYKMTRFLVAAIASWSCTADRVMQFTDIIVKMGWPTDGVSYPVEIDPSEPNPVRALSIFENDLTEPVRREVKLFWGEITPGVPNTTDAGMFFAWDTAADGTVNGRVVVDAAALHGSVAAGQPTFMRMDFSITNDQNTGEMFLAFEAQNEFTNAFRIKVVKNLGNIYPKYEVQGNIDVKAQFDPNYLFGELPSLKMYAVANSLGKGAAIARVANLGFSLNGFDEANIVPFEPGFGTSSDNLGSFLFTKDDEYYFAGNSQGTSSYTNKAITTAHHKGDWSFDNLGAYRNDGLHLVDANGEPLLDDLGNPIVDEFGNPIIIPFASGPQALDHGISLAEDDEGTLLFPGFTGYSTCVGTPLVSNPGCIDFLNVVFAGTLLTIDGNSGTAPDASDPRQPFIEAAKASAPGADENYFFANSCPGSAAPCVLGEGVGQVFEMFLP
ncbi:MAG: hypothetical protein OEZ59_01075 [Deltaproteobacteria bacterium]|nr:hypothetical protein [Deltaproteobacteria bacterium]